MTAPYGGRFGRVRSWGARRAGLLVTGCLVLGLGVALLLAADAGSDGYSTLVNGVALATGVPFYAANVGVGLLFLLVAASRGVYPGIGTLAQVVLVGVTVSVLLPLLSTPDGWSGKVLLLAVGLPTVAVGVAAYLGSQSGAGPIEAAALAWDPPLPFRWSYGLVQAGGALTGWLLGATVGPATVAVVVLIGPLVDIVSRLLRLDVHQTPRA